MSPVLATAKNMSSNTDSTLNSSREWEAWNNDFQARAIALDLWSYVDPSTDGEALLEKPKRPEVTDYKKHQNPTSQVTPTESTATVGPNESSSATHNTTSAPSTSETPARCLSDLSPRDYQEYQFRWKEYNSLMREYNKQQDRVLTLQSWVTSTVARHYRYTCCDASESLRAWYANLREQVKSKDVEENKSSPNTRRPFGS